MLESFLHEEMMRDLWAHFWVGLFFMGFFVIMVLKFPNSILAALSPFGILAGFFAVMYAVIQFAGGFTSFLGVILTIVSIVAGITTVLVNFKKLTDRTPADGTKRGRKSRK